MKTKFKFLFVVLFGAISMSFSQSTDGYTYHETSNGVSLYYKVSKYGVTFRAVNKRSETVYVKVTNVVSTWTDGRTRQKNVIIGRVASQSASNGGGLNNDNYSELKTWKFDSWVWSYKAFY